MTTPETRATQEQRAAAHSSSPYGMGNRTPAPASDQWSTHASDYRLKKALTTLLDNSPNLGPSLEKIIIEHPVVTKQTAAALAYSGFYGEDSTVLERIMAEQEAATAAANDSRWRKALKTGSRYAIVGMEDVWNNAPLMHWSRVGINLHQGKTLAEANEASSHSTIANHIALNRLGFDADYGDGFIPATELIPGQGGLYLSVKQMILDGSFEGSPEERMIQAEQYALAQAAEQQGISPYAMSIEGWESTHLNKTRGGIVSTVPFSPGAAVAIHFTTPGTAAYSNFSGLVDGTFRMLAEPTDLLLDNMGDVFMQGALLRGTQKVSRSAFRFVGDGSQMMSEVLAGTGITYNVSGIPIPNGARTPSGGTAFDWATGRTAPEQVDGARAIDIDPEESRKRWQYRVQDELASMEEGGIDWWPNPESPYAKPYADEGITPNDVLRELRINGGENAEMILTIEHELIHSELQGVYFETVATSQDGVRVADYAQATSKAPDEVRRLSEELATQNLDQEAINALDQQMTEVRALGEEALGDYNALTKELKDGVADDARREFLNNELAELKKYEKQLVERMDGLLAQQDELMSARLEIHKKISAELEYEAVQKAYRNMKDGSWSADQIYKDYRRSLGLSNIMRPFLPIRTIDEYLLMGAGKRLLRELGREDVIQTIRKKAPYLDNHAAKAISETNDQGVIAQILKDAHNGAKTPGLTTVRSPGVVRDLATRGMDGWIAKTNFTGGRVSQAARYAGKQTRRMRAGVGNNILAMNDPDQTLETIWSVGTTLRADVKAINEIQAYAIKYGTTKAGIDEVAKKLEALSLKQMKAQFGDLYSPDMMKQMWDDWYGYENTAAVYWMSNKGKPRNWLWTPDGFKLPDGLLNSEMTPEAFMEAQFSSTHRIVPDIRSFRRLNSRRRHVYENIRKMVNNDEMGQWKPLGYEVDSMMHYGDMAFGFWRDIQLMRIGWTLRILPEEHLRFAGSGFSSMFNNPIDYLITAFNRLDFTIPGDDITLDTLIRMREGLGTGQIRDWRRPLHVNQGRNWRVVSRLDEPRPFWAGMSQEFLEMNQDELMGRLARVGRDELSKFLDSPEGTAWMARVSKEAKPNSSLKRIKNPDELMKYLDMAELRITQMTGGEGIWKDPATQKWLDLNDIEVKATSNMTRDEILNEIRTVFGEESAGAYGLSNKTLGDLQARLDNLRGFEIEALDEFGVAAWITKDGNTELRRLMGEGTLDDITITKEMPIGAIREMDQQLEAAYAGRNVEPPEFWSFPEGALDNMTPSVYRRATDSFFKWANAVPSKNWNRMPYFQQNMGRSMAEMYFYGNSEMRAAIDELAASNRSFHNMFNVGARQTLKEHDLRRFPKAFNGARERLPLDERRQMAKDSFNQAVDQGHYDRIPLSNDPEEYLSVAVFEALEGVGVHESRPMQKRGIYTVRNNRSDVDYTGFPELVYSGTGKASRTGPGRHPMETVVHEATMQRRGELEHMLGLGFQSEPDEIRKAFYDLPESDQIRVAEQFGYREYQHTGGITGDPSRASGFYSEPGQYGDYVDIHRKDHLAPELQDHLVEEGDIEQMFAIEEARFPALHNMDEDFVSTFNAVRARTRWRRNNSVRAELATDPGAKAFYGTQRGFWIDEADITWADVDDEIANFMENGEVVPIFADRDWRSVGEVQSVVPPGVATATPEQLIGFQHQIKTKLRHKRIHDNITAYFDENPDKFAEWWKGYTDEYNASVARTKSTRLFGATAEQIAGPQPVTSWAGTSVTDRQIIVDDIIKGNPDPRAKGSPNLLTSEAQKLYEKEIGRALQGEEITEFDTIYGRRYYQSDEAFTTDSKLKPVGRVHKDHLDALTGMGIGIEHQRQIGDVALLLDQLANPLDIPGGTPQPLDIDSANDLRASIHGVNGRGWESDPVAFMESWNKAIDVDPVAVSQTNADFYQALLASKTADQMLPGSVPPPDNTLFETVQTDAGWHWKPRSDVSRIINGNEGVLVSRMLEDTQSSLDELKAFHKDVYTSNTRQLKKKYGTDDRDEIFRNSPVVAKSMDDYNYQNLVLKMIDDGDQTAVNKGNLVTGGDVDPDFDYQRNSMTPDSWFNNEVPPGRSVSILIDHIDDNIEGFGRREARIEQVKKSYSEFKKGGVQADGIRAQEGFNLGDYAAPNDPDFTLKTDFSDVVQDDRNAAVARVFPGVEQTHQNFDFMETGGFSALPNTEPAVVEALEQGMQAAKFKAIEDTKALFYDLSNKSNIADSLKFLMPFGDAWWEVLSRWGSMMNPARSGGQSLRNARRLTVAVNAAQQSGFISTNEYGEEVFNIPGFGAFANKFIPNSANMHLQGKMAISSMMFIDPTARGVLLPGVSPAVQVTNALTAPAVDAIPIFKEQLKFAQSASDWFTFGGQDKYRPGKIDNVADVVSMVTPTVIDRFFASVFDQQHREVYGNTKFRLFQSLGSLGDPEFNLSTPEGARKSWDTANTAGTWLGWLRGLDAVFFPGQPQYFPEFDKVPTEADPGDLTLDELLEGLADAPNELRNPVISSLRASAEYRLARELFSDAEADLYMMERYGFVPSFLQSATQGLVERPVTWGGVTWVDDNEWLIEHAPFTYAATVPPDADDTFSSEAWNNLFGEFLEVEGIENKPVRTKRSPSELIQSIQRGMGYDQLRFQQAAYEKAVDQLRLEYGDGYASKTGYRSAKLALDQKLRENKNLIQAEWRIVSGSRQGNITGSRQGVTDQMYSDEIIDIGTVGTEANDAFRENVPALADVAESYAGLLGQLYTWSSLMERGTASPDWWRNGQSDIAEAMRETVADAASRYFASIEDPHAKEYARWINQNIMDPFMEDWEWINNRFAPQLATFPTTQFTDTIGVSP